MRKLIHTFAVLSGTAAVLVWCLVVLQISSVAQFGGLGHLLAFAVLFTVTAAMFLRISKMVLPSSRLTQMMVNGRDDAVALEQGQK